jgi:hypothetical protein
MTDPEMQFDSLSNTHPVPRKWEKKDPRNDKDYDTFTYGTEPLPGDKTWCFSQAKMRGPIGKWKGVGR